MRLIKLILQALYWNLYRLLYLSVPITDTVKISILPADISAVLIIGTPLGKICKVKIFAKH